MTETKTARLLTLALAAAIIAAGCARRDMSNEYFGQLEPAQGQTLRYISGSEPESLDPQMSSGQPEARLDIALYEGLVEYHPKTMQPIPAVAERWEPNKDASEFTFFLRRNAKFSNGDPITAHDFAYSFRRGLRPELASRVAYLAYELKYAEAFNTGSAFVRDPKTGRFLLASETSKPAGDSAEAQSASMMTATPPDAGALDKEELAEKGEGSAPETEFSRFIHSPERLVVPNDEKDREKAFKADPKLKELVEGKEFVPVTAEDIGVEAVDDYTLRLTLRQPAPYFLGLVQHQFFRVIPEKIVEQWGVNWTKPEHIVTSGSHMLLEHKPYNQIVVGKNPHYWDAANVRLEKIYFYPLEDNTTMMNLYKAGEVDAAYNHTVPASWLKSGVRKVKDYMDAPENVSEFWVINTRKPPMNDVRVRKAFNMSIDKAALADVPRRRQAELLARPLRHLPRLPAARRATSSTPQRAKQLLAEAGYGDASGKFDPSKFPVAEVEINYNTNESNRQIAEFVQAQWKQNLGLTIALKNMEWKTFLPMRSKLEYKGFARAGWVGDYMDPYTFLDALHDDGGRRQRHRLVRPEVRRDAQRGQPRAGPRRSGMALLAKAEALLLEVAAHHPARHRPRRTG